MPIATMTTRIDPCAAKLAVVDGAIAAPANKEA